jgi:hypothetical protein
MRAELSELLQDHPSLGCHTYVVCMLHDLINNSNNY